jgi:hypothetical protein
MRQGDLLLLVARDDDPIVAVLERHAGRQVVHARPADFSREGWRYRSNRPDLAGAFAGGRRVAAAECAAVLCRVAAVVSSDLPHLDPQDRHYAAAEITAFLHAWLLQFRGMRCNEPTWMSLSGPAWHPLQMANIVGGLGIPATAASGDREATAVVVGSKVFATPDPVLIDYSRRIARECRSNLLALRFVHDGGWKFQSLDSNPAIDADQVSTLLDALLQIPPGPARLREVSGNGSCAAL